MTAMTKTMMTAGLGAVLALGLSACGSGDGPEDAVEEFANAAADKDYAKVCEMLDPEFVKTVESAGEGGCADTMKKSVEEGGDSGELVADPDKLDIGDATISEDGNSATVKTTYDGKDSDVKLVKVDDAWKITLGM